MKKFLVASVLLSACALSLAKLPAPSDEAKAKAAEAAAKTAWTGKVDSYALCKAQDKSAAKTAKSGKAGKPTATPPCADPGPFVYKPVVTATAPGAKPLEAAGAHSPSTTAVSPPSTKVPAAAMPGAPAPAPATAPAKKP